MYPFWGPSPTLSRLSKSIGFCVVLIFHDEKLIFSCVKFQIHFLVYVGDGFSKPKKREKLIIKSLPFENDQLVN